MKAIVCGSRDNNDRTMVFYALDTFNSLNDPITQLAQGGAKGVDDLAKQWAVARGIPVETYVANWSTHGRSAGPIRNRTMLNDFRPDIVIAFPGGRGTQNMVDLARAANVKCLIIAELKPRTKT